MRVATTAPTLVGALLWAVQSTSQPATVTMKTGGVYCISQAAIEEHLNATSKADIDRVRDILQVRRICDYAQAPVIVVVLESRHL